MKTCKLCNKDIPGYINVNGERKNLCSRKYCLDCSPYGQHNTKKLKTEKIEGQYCSKCKKYLPVELFGIYKRKENNSYRVYSYCKKCDSQRIKSVQREIKQQAVNYKGSKCEICGYNKCLGSLHFHHLDPKEKDFAISAMKKLDMTVLKKELDKCILVCSNCHGEIHEKIENEKTECCGIVPHPPLDT